MIRKAFPADAERINALLLRNGLKPDITENHLKEECLIGDIDGDIRGMIWLCISEARYLAFIDYFVVDPAYKGLGGRLAVNGLKLLQKKGVHRMVSVVENAPSLKEAKRINEFFGMQADERAFHFHMGRVS